MRKPVRIGVGGPVGSGKTALIEKLCKSLRDDYRIAVVTNDIFTKEDCAHTHKGGSAPGRQDNRCGDGRMSAYGGKRGYIDEPRCDRCAAGQV